MSNQLPQEWLDQLQKMVEQSAINNSSSNQNQQQSSKGGNQKKSPDELLFQLATSGRHLYYDTSNTTYIEIQDVKLQQAINTYLVKIESNDFRKWLKREYRLNYKKLMPNKSLVEAVQDEVSEEARINGEEITMYNRIAYVGDVIYIDLGTRDRSMVKITKNGWLVGHFKVFFKRHDTFAELPVPITGGNIHDLIPFLPQLPESDICMLLSWLIASFFGDIERAFLLLEGDHGSGKTRIAKLLKSFIDPSDAKVLTYNDKIDEVAQQIDHNCLPIFDNVSSISRRISDLICGTFSESSHVKKTLYTDDGDFLFSLSGNVMFTTIGLKKPQKDLLDRCYKLLVKKTDSSYQSKQVFTNKLEPLKPQLFGAILDTVVGTMNKVEELPITGNYRTVDFDRHALAAAIVMGFGADQFHEARRKCEKTKIMGIAENTPLVESMTNYLESNNNYFAGYMSQLVESLPSYTVEPNAITKHAHVLSKQINQIKCELAALGISVISKGNDYKGAKYEITRTVQEPSAITGSQQVQPGQEHVEPSIPAENLPPASDDSRISVQDASSNDNKGDDDDDPWHLLKGII